MKKVLLVTRPIVPPWDEASKNFAYFLGRSIADHSLTLLTTSADRLEALPESTKQEPIYTSTIFNWKAKFDLFRYLRQSRGRFDVTHYLFTPTKFNTKALTIFAPITKGKTIQTVATLRSDLYSEAELKALLFADRITVYTDATKQKLETMGVTNVERIYPGIDLEKYQPRPKNQAVLDSYKLTSEDFLVVYPGEYSRLGATDYLVETLIKYFSNPAAEPFVFLFACRIKNEADRTKREEVRERFRAASCLDRIRFDDGNATADMATVYNTADVIAFPVGDLRGKFDVPLVIIEAYASGKPVILSDLEAFREFSNDQISVTIPRLDGQALIDTILYLKHNSDTRAAIGQTARTYAETHFDLRETARAYADLYSSL
ncbi:MAG: glycosyltransferase family 4 protein [Candidatus Moraniibacteriota bacterium]